MVAQLFVNFENIFILERIIIIIFHTSLHKIGIKTFIFKRSELKISNTKKIICNFHKY